MSRRIGRPIDAGPRLLVRIVLLFGLMAMLPLSHAAGETASLPDPRQMKFEPVTFTPPDVERLVLDNDCLFTGWHRNGIRTGFYLVCLLVDLDHQRLSVTAGYFQKTRRRLVGKYTDRDQTGQQDRRKDGGQTAKGQFHELILRGFHVI